MNTRVFSSWLARSLLIAAFISWVGTCPAAEPTKATERLERAWPGHPEWAAMLADILDGSQLGPEDGWFKKATAQPRFTWEATRAKLDADGDGRVGRAEFPGLDADFARLDRDRDGSIGAADFDFTAHALMPSPGSFFFNAADRDGNGKVTPEEFNAVFKALDADKQGFLALADLQRAFAMPARRPAPSAGSAPAPAPASSGPSKWTLIKGLFRQEIGSLQAGPALGELAPDFTLKTVDGRDEVTLSKLVGPKPVVLVFGNFSCGPFRSRAGDVEKLYARMGDRADFAMVYVREAHPTDGWQMESNDRVGVSFRQPTSFQERTDIAQTCARTLGLGMPTLVDAMDDRVGAAYSGMPSRLYLIDRDGKVAYKSGRGPFGFKPAELEHQLLLLLAEGTSGTQAQAARPAP